MPSYMLQVAYTPEAWEQIPQEPKASEAPEARLYG